VRAAINRVMQTFTMMTSLTPEEMQVARERLTAHLEGMDADEKTLAVEGLRYLRGANRGYKQRTTRKIR
jgi:hypothetical protein